ncbi:oxidoreductase, short chain dehydrogenase/reductase family protein [Necator americanus]|uniref:Oxidoreductase, short chain dehydrogenase/reductase family protein n=1 Tax=Necator americanus TaxID=51031 RepID=W2TQZ4_NECAM|nr:oxidoreductase, short chain dehydrogenase/reductase family protein [Necator americanus]ETN84099.1 oxidoreductase, short chain dehydrogenase/reductase family protein [Necator americanus]
MSHRMRLMGQQTIAKSQQCKCCKKSQGNDKSHGRRLPDFHDVTGNVIVITGGASGLGRRMSQILAVEKGAKLIVIDIDSKGAEGTTRSILDGGGQAKAYHCDIRDEHEMERIAHRIHEDYGKVDIVLCNAAVLSFAPFMELTTRELLQSLEVNVIGTINALYH